MIKLILLVLYNVLRTAFNKLIYRNRFQVNWLQRISPFCTLKIFNYGTIQIGRNCEFAPYCNFEVHGNGFLKISEGTYFNRYCMISTHASITIGKHCMFGPGVKVFDNNHSFSKEVGVSSKLNADPIIIGDNCWIASDAIILKGARIGNNCVIGAQCIVRGEIEDGSIIINKQEQVIKK